MVKSKKMSKTGIAVIVLALLLVLSMVMGLTGAWFTKSNAMNSPESNSLQFGTIGDVAVVATGVKHYAAGSEVELTGDRANVIMPGDKVTAGGLTLTYAASDTPTDTTVWYLVKDQAGIYYVKSGSVLVAVADAAAYAGITGNANKITKGTPIEVAGQVLSVQIGSVWYNLDGSNDGASEATGADASHAKESWQIGEVTNNTSGQGAQLSSLTAMVGDVSYNTSGTTYAVAVVQTTNLESAQNAFAALKAAVDAALASPSSSAGGGD